MERAVCALPTCRREFERATTTERKRLYCSPLCFAVAQSLRRSIAILRKRQTA